MRNLIFGLFLQNFSRAANNKKRRFDLILIYKNIFFDEIYKK